MTSQQRGPMSRGEFFAFVLLAAVVGLLFVRSRGERVDLVPVGTPLPPLMATGWLNTDQQPYNGSLKRENLQGKVIVVDCWATWCPPCRRAMPRLAKLYAQYRPLGVEFLGLTSETQRDLPAIQKFIRQIDGFDWPVGYGTMPMQDMLGIQVLPTVIVFGADGKAVWSSSELDGIELVLDGALALGD